MSAKKVIVLVGDYVEDYEVMVPFQILQIAGTIAHAVCPGKKAGDKVVTAIHDFEGEQTYSEKRGHNFTLNFSFDDVRADDYDGLLIPGGRAPEYLRLDPRVLDLTRRFAESSRPLAAICHGPQILAAANVVQGKRGTAYPSLQPELEARGMTWLDPGAGFDKVHVDGQLVTAPAWPANGEWTKAFLQLLGAWPK